MSCTVVTEPAERDDKTLLILWENEGNISIDEETLEKLSETEPTPVSVLRLSANPVEQELSDGVGNINITVKEVYPDIMARLVDPATDEMLIQDGAQADEVPSHSMEDILSPDEHATFLSWTVAFDHWYTGEPLPPVPSFLGPLLEVDGEEPPLSPLMEESQPTANTNTSTVASVMDTSPIPPPVTSAPAPPTLQPSSYHSPMGLPLVPGAPVRGRGRGRGRPRKDGMVSGTTPRGRGRGDGRRGSQGRGRGAKVLPSRPHPLLLGSHLRPSLVPLVTPLMIAADESELRRSMTFRQAIIPVTDGKARLVALVPKVDEPRTDEVKFVETSIVEAQPVEPTQLFPTEQESAPSSTNQHTVDIVGMQDVASITQPVLSPEKSREPASVDLEPTVFTQPETPGSLPESNEIASLPADEAAPVAANDSFTHVMQSVMRRRRGGGGRGAGPLKLRDYDSELEDALAFVTADLDRQSPLQLRLSPPPPPPPPARAAEEVVNLPEEPPEKMDVRRTYKRRNVPIKLPSPPAPAPEEPPKREVKEHVKPKPQVNNKPPLLHLQPQPQPVKVTLQPRTPSAQHSPRFPAFPAVVPSPGKFGQGHDGGHKRYPKRENRKAPAYLEKEFDSVLFSTPDIIRSVHSENAREQKVMRPDDKANEKSPTAVGQDLMMNSRIAASTSELASPRETGANPLDVGGGAEEEPPPSPQVTTPTVVQPDPARTSRSQTDTPEAQPVPEQSRGGKRGAKSASPSLVANKKRRKSEDKRKQAKSRNRRQVQESSDEDDDEDRDGDGSESEDDPDRLWCLCRKPHNNRFMIRCDGCEDWFHGTCVGVTEAEGHRMENRGIYWSCPKCSEVGKQQADQMTSAAATPISGKAAPTSTPAKNAVTPALAKAVLTSAATKAAPAPVQAKGSPSPAATKIAQPPVLVKAAQVTAPVKAAQVQVQAKAAQVHASAKNAQAHVLGKAAPAPVLTKASQPPVQAKAAQTPAVVKVTHAATPPKVVQAPTLVKVTQALAKVTQPAPAKVIQAPAPAKVTQAPALPKATVAAVPAGASNVSKRDQMMARRQEAMLTQKSVAGTSTKPSSKLTFLKEKPEKADEAQVQRSPVVSPTATIFSVAEVGAANKPVVSTPPVVAKAVPAARRELVFKAASSSEVSVRVYDKVTGKVLTGANAPKLAELKTWLEEHPTYEVAQRSLKPPPSASSPTKKEQQDVPTSPQEKTQAQRNATPVVTPTVHRLILPKPREVDEPPGKQRRESVQEKQPALVAKRQKRSASVQNNKKVAMDVDKDGASKPTTGKVPLQVSTKKDQSQPAATAKTGSPKKVDSKRSTSSEHDKDEEKQKQVPSGPEPIRQNVCRSLQELLQTRAKDCPDLEVKEDEIQKIASSIEEEMYALFRDTGLKYKAKYRSLVFNIKDPKNVTLFRKIIESLVTPFQLVRLTPEELASQELAQWREREAKHQLDMIKKTELDLLNNPKIYVVKTHKGELEIEKEPSEFAGPVAMAEAAVSADVVSSEGGLGFMEEEVVSVKEEGKHEKKEKHRHKDKKKHKKESKHKDREHKEKGEQHRHRDDQHRHRDGEHERKKSKDEEDKHRHKEKEDHEKKKSKDRDEHGRHKESDHEKKKSKDKEEKQKYIETEHEKKKIKIEEEQNANKESDTDKKRYKEKDHHKHREADKEKKEIIDEHLHVKESSIPDQEAGSNGYIKSTVDKEVKDYQFFMSESNADESLENFEQKLEESIQAEMKFENENSTDFLDNIPSSSDMQRSFLSVTAPVSAQLETELGEESALFDRDSNSSLSAGTSQKTKSDAHTSVSMVWSGYINMAGVSNVSTSAKLVYGSGKDLTDVLPNLLEVVGRIDPDTVWDYISKVKRSGTKEILVLRLASSGGDAKVSYCTLYKHLHSKNRFGVIGNLPESTRIKDFYIMPLASHSPVPQQLALLDGQIFEGPRPHILVCLIIRTVTRQAVAFPESSQLSKRSVDSSRCVTPSPDPSTPRYPSLQEAQAQFSDDSEGANSDTSSKRMSKVEAYIPKPVDSSKITWKQIYPSASSNDSFPELSEDYDEASRPLDGEDVPYSPGEDINETVEINTETRSSLDLQHTVDELDKIIDKRREEIKNISSAIGLTSAAVPEIESLQMMSGMADTSTALADEDEAYSPSYSPPPREQAPSNSSLPPTILDILRNIPKQSASMSPSPQKKPKLADDSIVQSYGDKSHDTDEEVPSRKHDDGRYSPSDDRYSPSDEHFSPVDNQYSPSDQCYSPPNAASLTFLHDDPQTLPLKEAYRRSEQGLLKERLPGQPLPPGSELPPEALSNSSVPVVVLDQPLPPGVENKEFQSYGASYVQGPAPVMVPAGFAPAMSSAYMYHTVTSPAALPTGPPLQFVVPPPSYHAAPAMYTPLAVYPDTSVEETGFSQRRHQRQRQRHQQKGPWARARERKKRMARR